jgi:transposase
MKQEAATEAVRAGVADGTSVRRLAQITGWSVGWVSELAKEFRAKADLPAQQSRDELDALQECIDALDGLEDAGRRRILLYLGDRFGVS